VLTTCQPSTVWCSRERLPAAAAQPAQGSSDPVAPRIYYYILFYFSSRFASHKINSVPLRRILSVSPSSDSDIVLLKIYFNINLHQCRRLEKFHNEEGRSLYHLYIYIYIYIYLSRCAKDEVDTQTHTHTVNMKAENLTCYFASISPFLPSVTYVFTILSPDVDNSSVSTV
jgi:hypothetical protein